MSVECSQLLSEAKVHRTFDRARSADKPCIILFDELDSISTLGNQHIFRAFMEEMAKEPAEVNQIVFIIGATNKPDTIASSISAHMKKFVYVRSPDRNAREAILKENIRIKTEDDSLLFAVKQTEGFSVAELIEICKFAVICAKREKFVPNCEKEIKKTHWKEAIEYMGKPVSSDEIHRYERFETNTERKTGLNRLYHSVKRFGKQINFI